MKLSIFNRTDRIVESDMKDNTPPTSAEFEVGDYIIAITDKSKAFGKGSILQVYEVVSNRYNNTSSLPINKIKVELMFLIPPKGKHKTFAQVGDILPHFYRADLFQKIDEEKALLIMQHKKIRDMYISNGDIDAISHAAIQDDYEYGVVGYSNEYSHKLIKIFDNPEEAKEYAKRMQNSLTDIGKKQGGKGFISNKFKKGKYKITKRSSSSKKIKENVNKITIRGTRGSGRNKIAFAKPFSDSATAQKWLDANQHRTGIDILSIDNAANDEGHAEYFINESLPPHLAKFFDKDGNLVPDAQARVDKHRSGLGLTARPQAGDEWQDVTPKGYGPEDDTLNEKLIKSEYTIYLEPEEYQDIRRASMRGKFNHDFSRSENGNITFKTLKPVQLAYDLGDIIDFGATTAAEVLGVTTPPIRNRGRKFVAFEDSDLTRNEQLYHYSAYRINANGKLSDHEELNGDELGIWMDRMHGIAANIRIIRSDGNTVEYTDSGMDWDITKKYKQSELTESNNDGATYLLSMTKHNHDDRAQDDTVYYTMKYTVPSWGRSHPYAVRKQITDNPTTKRLSDEGYISQHIIANWEGDLDQEINKINARLTKIPNMIAGDKRMLLDRLAELEKAQDIVNTHDVISETDSLSEDDNTKLTYDEFMGAGSRQWHINYIPKSNPQTEMYTKTYAIQFPQSETEEDIKKKMIRKHRSWNIISVEPGEIAKTHKERYGVPAPRRVGDKVKTRNIKTKRNRIETIIAVNKKANGLTSYELDSGRIIYDQDIIDEATQSARKGTTHATRIPDNVGLRPSDEDLLSKRNAWAGKLLTARRPKNVNHNKADKK